LAFIYTTYKALFLLFVYKKKCWRQGPKSDAPRFIRSESRYQLVPLESARPDKQRRAFHSKAPKFASYATAQNSHIT